MNPSTTDAGLPLPTDLTSEMNDGIIASLLRNINEMCRDTAATTNSELPLDLTSYPQFDPFSTWLNDPSPVDYSFMESDIQALLPLPPF
jgi:hypothetical protein